MITPHTSPPIKPPAEIISAMPKLNASDIYDIVSEGIENGVPKQEILSKIGKNQSNIRLAKDLYSDLHSKQRLQGYSASINQQYWDSIDTRVLGYYGIPTVKADISVPIELSSPNGKKFKVDTPERGIKEVLSETSVDKHS